jgi:hypothetical protein
MKHHLTKKNVFLLITTIILTAAFIFIAVKLFRDTGSIIEQFQEMESEN